MSPIIRVKVLYFGQAREAAGTSAEEFSLPARSSVKTLFELSAKTHGGMRGMSRLLRFAVNEEVSVDGARLKDGDTVAFLPPVAGG